MKKSIGPKTLVYPTPVFIVGTYDKSGKANVRLPGEEYAVQNLRA